VLGTCVALPSGPMPELSRPPLAEPSFHGFPRSSGTSQRPAGIMANPPFAPVPDLTHVGLQLLPDKSQYLVNFTTFERVVLPACPIEDTEWELEVEEDGCVLSDGTRRLCCKDLFALSLVSKGEGQAYFVQIGDASPKRLQDVLAERKLCEFSVQFGEPPIVQNLRCLRSRLSSHGCFIWWSLPSVVSALKLRTDQGKTTKWIYHLWHAWSRFLGDLKLKGPHLRRSNTGRDEDLKNLEDFPSVSSCGLIALLGRWCGTPRSAGGLANEEDRKVCKGVLNSLLQRLADTACTLVLFNDKEASWTPPASPEGDNDVNLQVVNGRINLETFERLDRELFRHIFPQGYTEVFDKQAYPVLDFMLQLAQGGKKLQWLYAQVVWSIACHFDEVVAKLHDPWAQLGGGRRAQHPPRRAMAVGELRVAAHKWMGCWRERRRALLAYQMGLKAALSDQQFLSIAVDCSRVGDRSTMLGALTLPDNTAGWAPPQATLKTQKTPLHLARFDSEKLPQIWSAEIIY